MKEHPILFSVEMVRAILEGQKTMTRRVIKPQPYYCLNQIHWQPKGYDYSIAIDHAITHNFCLYGQVGDHLWVRETWRGGDDTLESVWYRASGDLCTDKGHICLHKWRPAIFMPRKFSRITLEITNIKVERLNEITEQDAIKEGLQPVIGCTGMINGWHSPKTHMKVLAIDAFCDLWDSINKKKGYGWDINPWCWVISFKRIEV